MILTIIFLGMIILGIISIKLGDKFYKESLEFFGCISIGFGLAALIISIIAIILSHAIAPNVIQKNKIDYEGLCMRAAIIESEYEDVSKSDVIADITAWNMKVYNAKYWTYNPWTNWFNPKEIADNLDYILWE